MSPKKTTEKKADFALIKEVILQTDQSNQRVVVLKEDKDSDSFFMMFVGESEFMAIAKEKGLFSAPRPMTHEIYLKIFERAPVEFEKVEIHSMTEGTYFANIYYRESGKKRELDARPSDSVSLALRMKIPILVNRSLMRSMLTPKDVEDFKDIIKTVKF